MSDRGDYRAIRRVLLDGPDFQRLPERARWVFLALKLNFGPAGIEVWYPAELVARLSAQTGASNGSIQDALNTLEGAGWIQREGNVVWIVGQLENDPHVKQADKKHRTMMLRHVLGLPRLAIVSRYVKAHAGWFSTDVTAIGAPSEGLAWAFEGPSDTLRSTEDREQKTENQTEDESLGSSGDDPGEKTASGYPTDFDAVFAIYPKRTGGNSKREAYMAWRARLRAGVPTEALYAGVQRYAAYCAAEGKIGSSFVKQAASFFGPGEHYLEPWGVAPPSGPTLVTSGDDAAWSATLSVVAQLARRELDAESYKQVPEPIRKGLSAIGGWTTIRDAKANDLPFRRKDFLVAYHAAERMVGAA